MENREQKHFSQPPKTQFADLDISGDLPTENKKQETKMKIIKSGEIKNELNQTTRRLDELTELRCGITETLQTLQQGFIDGKTSLDELQSEQGKLTTLNESIKALEAKQDELHDAFQKASLSESHQTLLESARSTALEAQKFFDESIEIRAEFDKITGEFAEKLCDKFYAFRVKKNEYERLRDQFDTETPGISADVRLLVERNYENLPPIKFYDAIMNAVGVIAGERDRKDMDKRRAARASDTNLL